MRDVTSCPECGGYSELVNTTNEWNSEVRHVRICSECPTEYTVSYADPVVEEVTTL